MTLLNGCGKKEGGTNPDTTKAGSEPQNETGSSQSNENNGVEESDEDSGEWTGEISKIIMTYPTTGVDVYKRQGAGNGSGCKALCSQ